MEFNFLLPESSYFKSNEPFGLGRFSTDRCYAPQVNGRNAALLLTNFILLVWYFGIDCSATND